MRPICLLTRRFSRPFQICAQRRNILTLAIETSCDDTSVAVLEKHKNNSATLHFHEKITSDNREYGGINPIRAHESHQKNLATLVNEALHSLPPQQHIDFSARTNRGFYLDNEWKQPRKLPDFITFTRGPGMRASLITGIDTAKGLAVAWQVPLLGVNHMQAHALTPRLVSAIEAKSAGIEAAAPAFPYLTLLVSGGHTMLVHSRDLCNHQIYADTVDIAIGDMLDKCARDILPKHVLDSAGGVSYGPVLEKFAFPEGSPHYPEPSSMEEPESNTSATPSWSITPPLLNPGPGGLDAVAGLFSFSGIGSTVKRIMKQNPTMDDAGRRLLARETMRIAFEHLASRVIMALARPTIKYDVKTLVVSGGVASNRYLMYVIKKRLAAKRYQNIELAVPPPKYCTDNAAMIAWTGIEMWEAGYRTELEALVLKDWSIDPKAEDGGILGVEGWRR